MPYEQLTDLPDNVRKFPEKVQKAWMGAFNSAFEGYSKDKHKNYDPKKTAKQNRESFAFAVANATLPKSNVKESLKAFGTILAHDVPIMSVIGLGRGALPFMEMGYHGNSGKKKKYVGSMMKELFAGTISVGDMVEAVLVEGSDDMSYEQVTNAVNSALRDRYPSKPGEMSVWPIEVFADRVIIRQDGKLMEIPFDIEEDGGAKLGEGRQVRIRYVPVKAS